MWTLEEDAHCAAWKQGTVWRTSEESATLEECEFGTIF